MFEVHGVDAHGNVVLRKTLRRGSVATFFANLPSCLVGMEASNGAHYRARVLTDLGHQVRLISPQFVAPYVKSNKSDRNDAEAICEAVKPTVDALCSAEVSRTAGHPSAPSNSPAPGAKPDKTRQSDSWHPRRAWHRHRPRHLSAALPPIRTASSRMISDMVEIAGSDVLPLFRSDGARLDSVSIRRARAHGETKWQWITEPPDGIGITAPEVLIRRSEVERFEQQHDLSGGPAHRTSKQLDRPELLRASSPGAPPRYDWNAFTGAVARRVHDDGMPSSQGELIRDMLDWFGATFGAVPDESTVRRRVQALWPVLTKRA